MKYFKYILCLLCLKATFAIGQNNIPNIVLDNFSNTYYFSNSAAWESNNEICQATIMEAGQSAKLLFLKNGEFIGKLEMTEKKILPNSVSKYLNDEFPGHSIDNVYSGKVNSSPAKIYFIKLDWQNESFYLSLNNKGEFLDNVLKGL